MSNGVKSPWFSLIAAIAGAALIVWLYLGGEAIEAAISSKAGREAIIAAIWSHVGWGVVTIPFALVYIFIRIKSLGVINSATTLRERAGAFVCWTLCAALVFLVITGPVVVWTHGSDLKVFDWFSVPAPTGKLPVIHDVLEAAHQWVAKAAPWLAGVDAAFIGAWIIAKR